MSLFSLPEKLTARVLASLERVDGAVAEAQLLLREARQELAAIRQMRQRVQGAIGEPEHVYVSEPTDG